MNQPISPQPVRDYRPEYLPAYVSNGLVGVRMGRIPFLKATAIVNGFYGRDPETHVQSFARAPFPLATDVQVGEAVLSRAPERAVLHEQRYDFSRGELHTSFAFDGDGARTVVEVLTLCSRSQPSVCLQEIRFRVDRACDLVVSAGLDPAEVPGRMVSRKTRPMSTKQASVDGSLRWKSHGDLADCGCAYRTDFAGADATRSFDEDEHAVLRTSYGFAPAAGGGTGFVN
jgi:hypothetical protein